MMKEGACVKYAFRVHDSANKFEVMDAVYKLFSVKPKSCNIVSVKEKTKTRRTRSGKTVGKVPGWKKAIVTLAKGDKISVFEGVIDAGMLLENLLKITRRKVVGRAAVVYNRLVADKGIL